MSKRNRAVDVFKFIKMGAPDECWPWTGGVSTKNRPYFSLDGKKQLAYRVVYRLVKGDCPDDKMILHSCDNSICCNPSHHTLGTHAENMLEMRQRERHGLPHHTVKAILRLKEAGISHEVIAKQFGIGRSTVSEMGVVNYTLVADKKVVDSPPD